MDKQRSTILLNEKAFPPGSLPLFTVGGLVPLPEPFPNLCPLRYAVFILLFESVEKVREIE